MARPTKDDAAKRTEDQVRDDGDDVHGEGQIAVEADGDHGQDQPHALDQRVPDPVGHHRKGDRKHVGDGTDGGNAEIRFDQQGDGEGVEYHGGYRQKFARKAEFGSIGQCNMPALFYISRTGDSGRSATGRGS